MKGVAMQSQGGDWAKVGGGGEEWAGALKDSDD